MEGCESCNPQNIDYEDEEEEVDDTEIRDFLRKIYSVWLKNHDIPFGKLILNPFEEEVLYKRNNASFLEEFEEHYKPL